MFWVYVIVALGVLAGGVTAVETYNHAITGKASAETRASLAEQKANGEHLARQNLQELVDYGDNLAADQARELTARDARLRDAEAKNRAAAKADPKAYACEVAPIPAATRQLRHDAFGPSGGDGVLHPAPGASSNPAPAAPGRDLRAGEAGGGPGPQPAALVQQGQGDGALDPGKAKPSTQSLRARLEALMRK